MLCLKKRRTYSFTQGACKDLPRRSTKEKNGYNEALNMAVTTLPRKHRSREERSSAGGMVLTVTEDTPADMLAGSMELLVQLPRDHHVHTQRVTVPRSTPMMDLLVQIATAHKLAASNYTLQAIGERGLVLPHQPNTPIGALDALQVKLLPKQGTFVPRKAKQANQPFETTFRLQVLLPRNQLYVSRVSPKMNLGKILEEVCREKNLDKNKYELRHPANLEETLDLSLSLQDYHLQEVTLYAKQGRTLGAALSSQDIMALQRQEERRRQHAKQSVFGFMFKKSKESSLSIDSLGARSVSPARSDETGRSVSPLAPPPRPQRKRRQAPKPPTQRTVSVGDENGDESKEKLVISHSRNSSDSSGYHEASVLSDNPDSNARMPETLPRRSKPPCKLETSRKLAQTSQASKSLGNLAMASGVLSHGISSTSINSTGIRKKRAAPPPPIARPLSSAISTQALERIVDSEESLTSDIDISKSPSDIAASSKANSDIGVNSKANSDIGVHSLGSKPSSEIGYKIDSEFRAALAGHEDQIADSERHMEPTPPPARLKPSLDLQANIPMPETMIVSSVEQTKKVESARLVKREAGARVPIPKPRSVGISLQPCEPQLSVAFQHKVLKNTTSDTATLYLSNSSAMETSLTERSTDGLDGFSTKIDSNKEMRKYYSPLFGDLREKKNQSSGHSKNTDQDSKVERIHTSDALKHVKSMDNIYGLSMKFADKEIPGENKSLSKGLSCAVISTIPKCVHPTPNIDDTSDIESEKSIKSEKNIKSSLGKLETLSNDPNELQPLKNERQITKRAKVFRRQFAMNDFDVKSFEKHTRHLTSHPESFTFALNPNLSRNVVNPEAETSHNKEIDMEANQINAESKKMMKNNVEEYPPFVIQGTNWKGQQEFEDPENEDNWAPQVIEQSASGDRTTETDILLQKVSDTLSNSLPSSESPPTPPPVLKSPSETEEIVVVPRDELNKKPSGVSRADDESDGLREKHKVSTATSDVNFTEESKPTEKVVTKSRESLLSEKMIVNASTPNATINSQQDTSDYVSATGDDLSITDWEYQLPAPPSAFRDNISPDLDGYDTITLRSVEAFQEPIASAVESHESLEAPIVDSPIHESPVPSPVTKEIKAVTKSVITQKMDINLSQDEAQTIRPEKSKLSSQTSTESQINETSSVLKKEIINELANKIENGSLPHSNSRITDQEFRRTTAECAAPKIAPVDNTLSNFTITTYSRQKSLNIFEEEAPEERQSVPQLKNSEDKVVRTFATLSRSKSSAQNNGGNIGSRNGMDSAENDIPLEEKSIMTRTQFAKHIIAPEMDFKRSEPKSHFTQHDSLYRRQSMNNGHEKSNVVHRSKSYITLANNSKYREDANGEKRDKCSKDEHDNGRVAKSTSVTNLNQEVHRNNEKFSRWRENILKRQEEPSKEKQLQSLQVLKSILPQLKSTQQTEENVPDSSNEKEHSHGTQSKTLPEANPNESKSNAMAEVEMPKPQKTTEDTTTKRYKYAGPPAVSLGSWSERPRVNVQLKMDTDYKFGANNTSGAKTVVNLNRTSGDRDADDQFKENSVKASLKNGTSRSNSVTAHHEATARLERRDSEDLLAKKLINHTTASGFNKPVLNRVGFPETKNLPPTEDKPVVTSVALKKTHMEKADSRVNGQQRLEESNDDVKIDTKPVNFKELTKTFGQEVCLRAKPKRIIQNRHTDYSGTRPDIIQSFSNTSNGQTSYLNNANKNTLRSADSTRNQVVSNGVQRDANHAPIKRYTSVVGIQSYNNNQYGTENGDSTTKCHNANVKINDLMPVVKGFKIQNDHSESKAPNVPIPHNGVSVVEVSKKNTSVPPSPPTMPIITGVTLKNSTARPKSMPINNADTRIQLLESIKNFGGRDKLRSVVS